MGNRVSLVGTTFTDATGEVSYGFRMFDDLESAYCNLLEAPVEDDLQLLRLAISFSSPATDGLLDSAATRGCFINSTWYGPEQLADVFTCRDEGGE